MRSTPLTEWYRIRTLGANDGATCFLLPTQALGYGTPDPVPAYAPGGRDVRPIQIPLDEVVGFEKV